MTFKKDPGGRAAGKVNNGARIDDPRFESMQRSSLYRPPSRRKSRIVLDKRFEPMLTDERFSSKAKVDRYGRKLQKSRAVEAGKVNRELLQLYRTEAETESDKADNDDDVVAELSRMNKKLGEDGYDPARDGGFEDSSSSEEDSQDEFTDEEAGLGSGSSSVAAEDGDDKIPDGEISRRLAAVNLDWDYIRAADLFAVFSSYAKMGNSSDRVENVSIYPSEFGKDRMQREEMEGPPKELFASMQPRQKAVSIENNETVSSDSEGSNEVGEDGHDRESDGDADEDDRIRNSLLKEDNGEEFSSSRLRKYQLERMRYFYAVITCSTASTAKEIYDNVDGREYLSSANFFDLRFIPDELDFSMDRPREQCSKLAPGYRPKDFVTAALQHSKVKLTWDEEDPERKEIQERAFRGSRHNIDENELRAYLASDVSSDEGLHEERVAEVIDSTVGAIATTDLPTVTNSNLSKAEIRRREMRARLGLKDELAQASDQTRPVGDMQITFAPGLSAPERNEPVFENEPEIEETTAEKYIRRERERKARRKAKMKAENAIDRTEYGDAPAAPHIDKGFNDPFFTATTAEAEALAHQQIVDKKKQRRAQRIADEKAAVAETEELERVLKPDSQGNEAGHFSLSALEKAEKALRKQKLKKGKGRLSQSEKAALEARAKDNFEMNVEDKRFTAVYDRPEFALDPSHPRFRDTDGMKSLLREARKRRNRDIEEEGETNGEAKRKKSQS